MSTDLLKEYLQLIIEGSTLTAAEMSKRPGRFDIFLSMMMNGESFITNQGEVTISPKDNPRLVAALKLPAEKRSQAYEDAFTAGVKTSLGVITSSKELLKSKQFGGFAGREREADANELQFADTIKKLVKKNGPITVVLGKKRIQGVVDAIRTGSDRVDGQVSKADVILKTKKRDVKISIKMKTADYYLSGDAQLAPTVGPVVENLLKKKAPNPRVIKEGNLYKMVTGPGAGAPINMSFQIDVDLANLAVFGSGQNTVDIIVKGDLSALPTQSGTATYTWPVTVYESVQDLPDADQPIGLLRAGEAGRGFTYNGTKYAGIRPAIATKKRAARAIPI